jgi:hypothetical protein
VVTAIVDRQSGPSARLDEVMPAGLTRQVRQTLARGLATDPHDRYWRASELVQDLDAALSHEERATLRPPPLRSFDAEVPAGRISLSSAPPPPRPSVSRVTPVEGVRRRGRSAMPSHSVACVATRLPSDPPPASSHAASFPHGISQAAPSKPPPLPRWSPRASGMAFALLSLMVMAFLVMSLVHGS